MAVVQKRLSPKERAELLRRHKEAMALIREWDDPRERWRALSLVLVPPTRAEE